MHCHLFDGLFCQFARSLASHTLMLPIQNSVGQKSHASYIHPWNVHWIIYRWRGPLVSRLKTKVFMLGSAAALIRKRKDGWMHGTFAEQKQISGHDWIRCKASLSSRYRSNNSSSKSLVMFENRNEHANERLLDSESIHAWTAHTCQRNNWGMWRTAHSGGVKSKALLGWVSNASQDYSRHKQTHNVSTFRCAILFKVVLQRLGSLYRGVGSLQSLNTMSSCCCCRSLSFARLVANKLHSRWSSWWRAAGGGGSTNIKICGGGLGGR